MRQRLHVRRVDRHHRVEEKGEVDALRFARELEGGSVAVEGPRPLHRGTLNLLLVRRAEQPFLHGAIGVR